MKRIATTVLAAFFLLFSTASAQVPVSKVVDTSWMERSALKWGMVGTFCTAQSMTGLVESWKFNGRHLVAEDNYHLYRTAQDVAWLGTGWMLYANVQGDIKWTEKVRNILGSACLARNAYEWSYKANRWGNPFDYDPAHTNNQKAIVYVKFQGGRLVDAYIGSGTVSGPIIDMAFLTAGLLLLR